MNIFSTFFPFEDRYKDLKEEMNMVEIENERLNDEIDELKKKMEEENFLFREEIEFYKAKLAKKEKNKRKTMAGKSG